MKAVIHLHIILALILFTYAIPVPLSINEKDAELYDILQRVNQYKELQEESKRFHGVGKRLDDFINSGQELELERFLEPSYNNFGSMGRAMSRYSRAQHGIGK